MFIGFVAFMGAFYASQYKPIEKNIKFFVVKVCFVAITTHMSDSKSTTPTPKNRLFGMQIPPELDEQLTEVSRRHGLTKSGIARMAIERGLVVLVAQLQTEGKKP